MRVRRVGYKVARHQKIHKGRNVVSIRVKNIIYIYIELGVVGKHGKKNIGDIGKAQENLF